MPSRIRKSFSDGCFLCVIYQGCNEISHKNTPVYGFGRTEATFVLKFRLKSKMNEFDNLKNTLSNVLDQKVGRETRLQEVLTNKILQIQKIANYLLMYDEKRPKEFREKVYSEIIKAEKDTYFGELHEVVNAKYAGIVDYLKREYPILTEDELNLCCLACFGFDNNLISFLFGHANSNSIFIKRHRLRKKLGHCPNHDSLETYLSKLISDLQSDVSDCDPTDVGSER